MNNGAKSEELVGVQRIRECLRGDWEKMGMGSDAEEVV